MTLPTDQEGVKLMDRQFAQNLAIAMVAGIENTRRAVAPAIVEDGVECTLGVQVPSKKVFGVGARRVQIPSEEVLGALGVDS